MYSVTKCSWKTFSFLSPASGLLHLAAGEELICKRKDRIVSHSLGLRARAESWQIRCRYPCTSSLKVAIMAL